jgi:hypothetical protein
MLTDVPIGPGDGENDGSGVARQPGGGPPPAHVKMALHVFTPSTATLVVGFVPEQAPDQPENA